MGDFLKNVWLEFGERHTIASTIIVAVAAGALWLLFGRVVHSMVYSQGGSGGAEPSGQKTVAAAKTHAAPIPDAPNDGKSTLDPSHDGRAGGSSQDASAHVESADPLNVGFRAELTATVSRGSGAKLRGDAVPEDPRQLLSLFNGRTALQADELMKPFKGHWIVIELTIGQVIGDTSGVTVVGRTSNGDLINARFSSEWARLLATIEPQSRHKVQGQIADQQNGQQLYLSSCEYLQ